MLTHPDTPPPLYDRPMQVDDALNYGYNHLSEIEGWLSPLDFAVITTALVAQFQMGIVGDIAEIGVWRGKSVILMSFLADGTERVYAIDVFDVYYPDGPPQAPTHPYADPALFHENLCSYGHPGRVDTVASDTRHDRTIADKIAGPGIRFFHIDGGHSYDHVIADLSIAIDAITPDAIVVLDDFLQVDNPAVSEAIFALLRDSAVDLEPFAVTPKKLYLTNAGNVAMYWRFLIALLPRAITRKRPLLGSTPLILNPPRFSLDRDFDRNLLRAVAQPNGDKLVIEHSERFPRAEAWLGRNASLNAETPPIIATTA